MSMREIKRAFWLILLAVPLLAGAQQASFVTMIGTNANYAGGIMTANFLPPANSSQFDYLKYRFPFTVSAPLNGSGVWTMSLADTSSVMPLNSQWRLQLCSPGTFGAPTCYSVTTPVTCINNVSCSGTTLDLTSSFAGAPIPPGGGGSSVWSALTNPTGNLSLTMGANNSAFANTNNFTTPGTFTSPWQFVGNGINFAAQWSALYNGSPATQPTDEFDVGIAVPNTSTSLQSSAIAGYASCAEPTGNFFCVALYGQAIRGAAGSYTHAFNANVSDGNLGSGYTLFGGEFNSQVHNVASGGATLLISANIDNAGTPYDALDINATGANPYAIGLNFLDGSATTALRVGAAKTGTGSMPVTMKSSAGTGSYNYDGSGNFNFSGPVVAPNTPLSPGTTVTDSFARSAGGLGSNWSGGSTFAIVSSGVVGSTSGSAAVNQWGWYSGGTFATNQCSTAVIQNVGVTGSWVSTNVNTQDGANMYALLSFNQGAGQANWQLNKIVAGAGPTLISLRSFSNGGAMVVGDQFTLCNSGGTLTAYRNGVAQATTATDSTFTAGWPGIGFVETSPIRISSFTGTGLTSNAVNLGGTFAGAGCTDFSAVTVSNAATTMACVMTGQGGNPANVSASCAVTAANTVTPRLCSFTAQTVTAQNYSVRVIP